MTDKTSLADHWSKEEVYEQIISALEDSGKSIEALTIEDLAPVDHFHSRGFAATIEMADQLPIKRGDQLVDIGSGIGGPARYIAEQFDCKVTGIDITSSFVDTATRLTWLLQMEGKVTFEIGDGNELPFEDETFDGGYSQHVTMNVSDRRRFFAEAYRVLKPRGYFFLSEHGRGPVKNPRHPLPWSADGRDEHLVTPEETSLFLKEAGFADIQIESTGPKYLSAYRRALELADKGHLSPFGSQILLGNRFLEIIQNAARNIEEKRTHPIQVLCKKPV